MTRRELIVGGCTLLGLGSTAVGSIGAVGNRAERLNIGAQTQTWGVPIRPYERLLEILDVLARLGFRGFETNFRALSDRASSAAACRRDFESRRVQLTALHCSGNFYDQGTVESEIDPLKRIADYSSQMGASYLIVSGERLPHSGGKLNLDAVHTKMDALNRLGRACREFGLGLCYHNHDQEFRDNPSEMSFLLKLTDPELVRLNYDVGEPFGLSPSAPEFSSEHFRRIAIYHVKDVVKRDEAGRLVPADLGKGQIDFPGIFKPLLDSDWKGWLTVERESGSYPKPADHPEQLLKNCREYIRDITGI